MNEPASFIIRSRRNDLWGFIGEPSPEDHRIIPVSAPHSSEIDRLITAQAAGASSGTAFRISISIFLRGRDSLYLKLR
jgi:hypothetical protein